MRIRRYRDEDYEEVIALWSASNLEFRPRGRDARSRILKESGGDTCLFLVAEREEMIIGTLFCTHDGRKGWINRLCVVEEERRRGVATRLMEEAEWHLNALGIEIVACLIYSWNSGSLDFLEALGYRAHDDVIYLSKRRSEES